jgi:hypothetical protein
MTRHGRVLSTPPPPGRKGTKMARQSSHPEVKAHARTLGAVAAAGVLALLGAAAAVGQTTGVLTLTPPAATNPVGTTHTLTATLTPAQSAIIQFTSTGAHTVTILCLAPAGQCTVSYTGTNPGLDTITACVFPCGPGDPTAVATKLWTGGPATLILTPPSATNTVGTSHTVTATVTDAGGQPVPGVVVRFAVTGTNTAGGSCTTGANGQCTFTYTGTVAGPDAIAAYADADNDAMQDPGEPVGTATKLWTPASPACPPGDDDEDDDGLEDGDESLLRTLLGNRDSDGDRIDDGNDDANHNGADDEDEDDGGEEECPNDSDGDDIDDEDEDD